MNPSSPVLPGGLQETGTDLGHPWHTAGSSQIPNSCPPPSLPQPPHHSQPDSSGPPSCTPEALRSSHELGFCPLGFSSPKDTPPQWAEQELNAGSRQSPKVLSICVPGAFGSCLSVGCYNPYQLGWQARATRHPLETLNLSLRPGPQQQQSQTARLCLPTHVPTAYLGHPRSLQRWAQETAQSGRPPPGAGPCLTRLSFLEAQPLLSP